jgi:hypothetical protein
MELTSVDEGFQDILLDAKIVVANGGELSRSCGRFSTAFLTP